MDEATALVERPIDNATQVVPSASAKDVVDAGREYAAALMDVVKNQQKKKLVHRIGSNRYLAAEAWLMIARFAGTVPMIQETVPVEDEGKVIGYKARAVIRRLSDGVDVSAAEALCGLTEHVTKGQKDEGSRRNAAMSMAQTRASAKACRIAYAHIVVLAGYEPTPAEEMGANGQVPIETHEEAPQRAPRAPRAPRVKKEQAEDVEAEEVERELPVAEVVLPSVGERDDKNRLICQGTILGQSEDGPDYGARCAEPVEVEEEIVVVWRDGKRWPVVVASIDMEMNDGRNTGSMVVRTRSRARLGDRNRSS